MTHKENITAILECYFPGFNEEIIESACNRILEQEPCDDAVSRQATIEAFQMFRGYESNRTNAEWVDRIETVVKQLPPVKPQEPCEDFKQKAGVVISQLRADRDRLEKEFKELERKIRAWQRDIHDNEDDAEEFDFVFDGIYEILAEHRKGEE